jgi:putative redox protein
MVTITLKAHDNLRMELRHDNGAMMGTDVPKASGGGGELFSPTDMLAAALLSCIVTTMGVVANKLGADISGTSGTVEKIYRTDKPHLIGALKVAVNVPHSFNDEIKAKLERGAGNCPVHHALSADITQEITVNWAA